MGRREHSFSLWLQFLFALVLVLFLSHPGQADNGEQESRDVRCYDYMRRSGQLPQDFEFHRIRGRCHSQGARQALQEWRQEQTRGVVEERPEPRVNQPRGRTDASAIRPDYDRSNPMLRELHERPTSAQLRCRRNASRSPKKVVFGFSGLGGYPWSGGLIRGMLGRSSNNNVDFHYYAWDSVSRGQLTDAVRCAYELATKPYRTANGQVVYNSITVLGHSFGGGAAYRMAANLQKLGVRVDLVATADARDAANCIRGCMPNWGRPNSVGQWLNFYQKNSMLVGYQIGGAVNRNIGGNHMTIPASSRLRASVSSAMSGMSTCRSGYSIYEPRGSPTDCNASGEDAAHFRVPATARR